MVCTLPSSMRNVARYGPEAAAAAVPPPAAEAAGALVFHAGTALHGERLVTNGGRILAVTGTGDTIATARGAAYGAAELIRFEGVRRRSDIAAAAAAGASVSLGPPSPG